MVSIASLVRDFWKEVHVYSHDGAEQSIRRYSGSFITSHYGNLYLR